MMKFNNFKSKIMKTVISFILLFSSIIAIAQQDSQYTQYMYNTVNVNPAYAGSREVLSIFLLHRSQWVGLDGAPRTNNLSANMPIENTQLGVGLSFTNDKIGPSNENDISADISYYIQLSEKYKLAFGIKATANLFSLDVNKIETIHQGDPIFQNFQTRFSPNIGAGMYLNSDNTYFGVSVPGFFETNRYNDNDVAITKERMHFYLIGGHVFNFNDNLKFKPAFLMKAVEGAPLQADLTANFLLYEKLTLGASYRWSAAISGLVGFQLSEKLFIGYGYDTETTQLENYNSGSHEVFLRFELIKNDRISTPRFF